MALRGVARTLGEKKGKHIVVSKIEGFPVLHSARALRKQGFLVTYLDTDGGGFVHIEIPFKDAVEDALEVPVG